MPIANIKVYNLPYLGGGGNRAVTELSFGHVTTKTWAYSGVFGFFSKNVWQKMFGKKVPKVDFPL